AEGVVDIAIVAPGGRDEHDLARARGRTAHAVDMPAIRIGAADHPGQQRIPLAGGPWQVALMEEHALAGASPHVDGGDPLLLHLSSLPILRSIFVQMPRSRSTSSTPSRVRPNKRRRRGMSFLG